jgi:peptidoglycan/LPS O-acetylase OafA/YrhL
MIEPAELTDLGVPMERADAAAPPRYDELDSLRGAAAMMVVLNHFFLASYSTGRGEDIVRFLADPLQNGPAAVSLFFVLSGFVLSIPVWRGKPQSYSVFLIRRVCRIYLPYLFALMLSVAGCVFFVKFPVSGLSEWFYKTWTGPVQWGLALKHILFIGPSYNVREFNTAFWTLIIEMRVSIIFPIFLLLMRRLSFSGLWALCVVTQIIGSIAARHCPPLQIIGWTGLFIAGAIVARAVHCMPQRLAVIFSRRLVAMACIAVFLFANYLPHWLPSTEWLARNLSIAGALGMLCAALYNRDLRGFLHTRVLRFVGTISYSLYLLHATVLYILLHLLYGTLPKSLIFLLYLAASLGVAALSYSMVERPAMELGRRLTRSRQPRPADASCTSLPQGSDAKASAT